MKEDNLLMKDLQLLGKSALNFENTLDKISQLKKKAILIDDEAKAKKYWIYETIVNIHKEYCSVFELLKSKEYYSAWRSLEKIEIMLQNLKRHYLYPNNEYGLSIIERQVINLQALYPYRLFNSYEMIQQEKKCGICDKVISLRNPCGHIKGEIYKGEMCYTVITKCKLLGISLVYNPVHKYTVLFPCTNTGDKTTDNYDYSLISNLINVLESPNEWWDLEIQNHLLPHSNFVHINKDESCPCKSGKKYNECCLHKEGIAYQHYRFIVSEETAKRSVKINY